MLYFFLSYTSSLCTFIPAFPPFFFLSQGHFSGGPIVFFDKLYQIHSDIFPFFIGIGLEVFILLLYRF